MCASLPRNMTGLWLREGALQADFKMAKPRLISSAFASKVFSWGSYLEDSSLILFLFIPVKFSCLWAELFLEGPNEDALVIFPKAMSACYSLEFASLVPAEGHFLFCNGYNGKNSFVSLNQTVHVSQGTGIENVCHSCLLPVHIATREDRLRGRQMW